MSSTISARELLSSTIALCRAWSSPMKLEKPDVPPLCQTMWWSMIQFSPICSAPNRLRGAWVAAGGGKWAAPMMVALNSMVGALHAPYVRDFSGFDRPWRHLERLVEDVQVQELAFGSGYVMTGRTPA